VATLLPTALELGEDYATIADIFELDDLPQATIRVPQWKRRGKPLAIRVRGLSLLQRDIVARESLRPDGTINTVAQIEATLREGVLVPQFDAATASRLRQKNPVALEQIAQFIWALSSLDQDLINATVTQLARADPAPADDAHDPPASDRA
jgi:hypothetical protein